MDDKSRSKEKRGENSAMRTKRGPQLAITTIVEPGDDGYGVSWRAIRQEGPGSGGADAATGSRRSRRSRAWGSVTTSPVLSVRMRLTPGSVPTVAVRFAGRRWRVRSRTMQACQRVPSSTMRADRAPRASSCRSGGTPPRWRRIERPARTLGAEPAVTGVRMMAGARTGVNARSESGTARGIVVSSCGFGATCGKTSGPSQPGSTP